MLLDEHSGNFYKRLSNDYAAGALIFVIAVFGIVVNLLASILLSKSRTLRGSFSSLCISNSLAQTGLLIILALWSAPLMMIDAHQEWSLLNRKLGQLILVFWFVILYTQILVALNRFCVIVFPMTFKQMFTDRRTKRMIGGVWIVSLMHGVVYFFPGCDFSFNAKQYYWEYSKTSCGDFNDLYLDYVHGITACGIVLSLNLITVIMLQTTNTKSFKDTMNSRELSRRKRRDLVFFAQACTNSLNLAFATVSYHYFPVVATTKWETFICTTLIWCSAHAIDGCVLLAFNSELRQMVFRPKKWFTTNEVSHMSGPLFSTRLRAGSSLRTTGPTGVIIVPIQ